MAKGRAVNLTELAALWGVSMTAVRDWIRNGCPYEQTADRRQGRQWVFDTAAVAAWREEHAVASAMGDLKQVDIGELRRRKLAAETGTAELEFGLRRGELIEVEKVADIVAGEYSDLRAKLLSLATKVAAPLGRARTIAQRKVIIHDAICESLAELSYDGGGEDPKPASSPRGRGNKGAGKRSTAKPRAKAQRRKKKKAKTTAKAQRKRVGRRKKTA